MTSMASDWCQTQLDAFKWLTKPSATWVLPTSLLILCQCLPCSLFFNITEFCYISKFALLSGLWAILLGCTLCHSFLPSLTTERILLLVRLSLMWLFPEGLLWAPLPDHFSLLCAPIVPTLLHFISKLVSCTGKQSPVVLILERLYQSVHCSMLST